MVIVFGTLQAAVAVARGMFAPYDGPQRRAIWLNYARWLIAGLTFQLAADIIETAITTEWEAIARVAAIAVIRTFLNYFLSATCPTCEGCRPSRKHDARREPSG